MTTPGAHPSTPTTTGAAFVAATGASAPTGQVAKPSADRPAKKVETERRRSPRKEREQASLPARIGAFLFFFVCALAVVIGFQQRANANLIAESGLGYALGIIGGSLMVLLLGYPLRKRAPFMRRTGPVKYWFRVHMWMGVIGPLCVLYHANYQLGSTNSNVALFSMLLVAGSGLIGRFIYTKVHYGLYGEHVTLQALREDSKEARGKLSEEFAFAPRLRGQLQAFESDILAPAKGPVDQIVRWVLLGSKIRTTRRRLRNFALGAIKLRAEQLQWTSRERRQHMRMAKRYIASYLKTVRWVGELGFYERVFSFWHVLHVPLFIMLVLAATLHIVAVHMY